MKPGSAKENPVDVDGSELKDVNNTAPEDEKEEVQPQDREEEKQVFEDIADDDHARIPNKPYSMKLKSTHNKYKKHSPKRGA